MKRMLFKTTLMIVALVGATNYLTYIYTGKSPISFSLPDLSKAKDMIPSPSLPTIRVPKTETAYKWKDENGVIHYSSEPPSGDQLAEKLDVNPDTNLVQGVAIQKKPEQMTKNEEDKREIQPSMPSGNIYKPETIQKLMNDANEVQEKLNERYENLEKM